VGGFLVAGEKYSRSSANLKADDRKYRSALETIVDPVAVALRKAGLTTNPKRKKKSRPRRKPASGFNGTAAKAFRMRKLCDGWAWSEEGRVDRDGIGRYGRAR
jgi:hypothetical protein